MDKDKIRKIRDIKIATVLGIKDSGRRISIKCPFHNERSASLVIYPDNSYYCYGCLATGQNAIDFVMALGFTFNDAINELDML